MGSIFFLHGYGASPKTLARAVVLLREHDHRVHVPHLTTFSLKHGSRNPQDWLEEATAKFVNYSSSVDGRFFLAGHSLGGVLCAHLLTSTLTQKIAQRIPACAFLATPAGIDTSFINFWQTKSSYGRKWPLALQAQIFLFLQQTDKKFSEVHIPCLVLQGGRDTHIPASSGKALCRKLGKYCLGQVTHPEADHFFPKKTGQGPDMLLNGLVEFLSQPPEQEQQS